MWPLLPTSPHPRKIALNPSIASPFWSPMQTPRSVALALFAPALAVAAALGAAGPLHAQADREPEREARDQADDRVVVTATRGEQRWLDSPYTTSRITAEQLERRSYRTLPQILRDTPGVMVQETAHGHGSPYIRGFTSFRTLMLVDGIRLNHSAFRPGPNQYWNTVDPLSIELHRGRQGAERRCCSARTRSAARSAAFTRTAVHVRSDEPGGRPTVARQLAAPLRRPPRTPLIGRGELEHRLDVREDRQRVPGSCASAVASSASAISKACVRTPACSRTPATTRTTTTCKDRALASTTDMRLDVPAPERDRRTDVPRTHSHDLRRAVRVARTPGSDLQRDLEPAPLG